MPALMTVSTTLIFCFIVVGQVVSCLHWFITLLVVTCVWSFHLSDGISWMPKYVLGSF